MYGTRVFLTAAVALALPISAQADDEHLKMRLAGFLSNSHYVSQKGTQVFIKEAEDRSGGNIEIEYYPSSQLGKSTTFIDLLQSKSVDLAELAPHYRTDKFQLSGVMELPGPVASTCESLAAYRPLVNSGGIINNAEYEPEGIHVLATFIFPPFKLMNSGGEITSLEDFDGLKLRSTGVIGDMMAEELGAVPINMTSAEIFDAISRGTIDSVAFPALSALAYGIDKDINNIMTNFQFGAVTTHLVIPTRLWEQLSPTQQTVLEDAGRIAEETLCIYVDQHEAEAQGKLIEGGTVSVELAPGAMKDLEVAADEVAKRWANEIDANGKPASQALAEFKNHGG